MANWPPKPDLDNNQPTNTAQPQQGQHTPDSEAWKVIESTMQAGITEQRRSRRWGIFFKILTFIYVILAFTLLGKGCSSAETTMVPVSSEHIAVVDVKGVINPGTDASSNVINDALSDAFKNPASKAVVLDINSPGGSPVQSDEVWQHIRNLQKENKDKKIYAFIGDVGTSGAYYIASAADEIWVNNSSIVGSIGVIMPNFDVQELVKKVGVRDRTITAGEHKNILNITAPISDFEKQHVQGMLDNVHSHFITAVKEGRGDKLKDVEKNKTFSGLFFSGDQAIAIGLADKAGSIRGIAKKYDVKQVVNYTPVDPMKELLDGFSMKIASGVTSAVTDVVLQQSSSEPVLK